MAYHTHKQNTMRAERLCSNKGGVEGFKEELMLIWILRDKLDFLLGEEQKSIPSRGKRENENDRHDNIPGSWKYCM